jgi:pyruvate formate lyase activating enzyme
VPGVGLDRLGLVKTSLIDYPGKVASVIFTSGCNFRCPYCHNPELARGRYPVDFLVVEDVIQVLSKRRNVLDGVVLTGGEPLIHPALPSFIDTIRSMGYQVKIDTNGSYPERLAALEPDYVAVDVKCSPGRYSEVTDLDDAADKLRQTIRWVISSGVDHEFRTTVVPGLVGADEVAEIAEMIRGTTCYVLNEFRSHKTLDPRLRLVEPYPRAVLEEFEHIARRSGIPCHVRGTYAVGT